MLSCSSRLGHLLTALTCSAGERLAVHHAALGRELARTPCPRRCLTTSLASEMMSSPPQTTASVPSTPSNAGASRVPSVARRARLFFTTSRWMFFLRSRCRSATFLFVLQADHVDQQRIVDAVQPLAEVVR